MSLLPATAYRLNWKFTISTCAVPARPCEVGKVSSHIWRHSLATYLLNDQRRNLREVQEILGHVRLETTARYTHIQTHARRDILSSICLPTIPELSRATVQTLFVSARAWDVSALLRELKESTGRWQKVKLENFILGLLEFGKGCPMLGLKLTIEGGRVDLSTTTITDPRLSAWLGVN